MERIKILGLGAVAALVLSAAAPGDAPQTLRAVSFAKEVAPILKAACAKCHGKDGKAKLDVTSYDALKKGAKSGPVIVEGDPDKSPLVSSISGDKPEMPKKAAPLTKAQVATISTWIKEGAKNN
jgi:mono/diheme cytochrome c family protein